MRIRLPVLVADGAVAAPFAPGVELPVVGVIVVGVPGVLAPRTPVVALGAVAPGTAAPGVTVVGTPGTAAVGVVLLAAVVTVVVTEAAVDPDPPASLTSAAASTPSASAAITATVAIGAFQLGVAARRVRAAAPQRRHQSCSGDRGVPQSGQASLPPRRPGTVVYWSEPAFGGPPGDWDAAAWLPVAVLEGEATVTSRPRAGG